VFPRRLGLALLVWLVMDYCDASTPGGAFFFEADGFYVEGVLGARGAMTPSVPVLAPKAARVERAIANVRPAARVVQVSSPVRAPSRASMVSHRLSSPPEAPVEDH
jgi:hypothetical protein